MMDQYTMHATCKTKAQALRKREPLARALLKFCKRQKLRVIGRPKIPATVYDGTEMQGVRVIWHFVPWTPLPDGFFGPETWLVRADVLTEPAKGRRLQRKVKR